ncbi:MULTISPECIES: hypothetical protein [unclassified Ensifer]|nr:MULTISPECIES: hypothetical protein [unclassified Ensifer]
MSAILEILIDALRLLTFQPPTRQTRHTGSDEAACAGARYSAARQI